ncbi:MAG: CBS domain-containing protein [Solobacterium sp.]|nr:CBS domain-containing protein [Solobacterium sp.]MBR3345568.1 CBS domain-containing protein [Solobacterium sp.]
MADKTDNAIRFLNAYASIERSLNQMLCKNDYVPFKRLVRLAAKNNTVVAKNEELLKEYADLRNAIVHQRSRTEEIIAEPLDSVTENIERIANLLNSDESVFAYSTTPVRCANETTTVKEGYYLIHEIGGDKLPVYKDGEFLGLITMDQLAGWMVNGHSADEPVRNLIEDDKGMTVFMAKTQSIMDAVLFFDRTVKDSGSAPVILVTENGKPQEMPIGILSTHDLSRILAALV